MSTEEAQVKIMSVDKWYGLVDGTHRWAAVVYITENAPKKWLGFTW